MSVAVIEVGILDQTGSSDGCLVECLEGRDPVIPIGKKEEILGMRA